MSDLTRILSAHAITALAEAYGPGCYLRVPYGGAKAAQIELLIGFNETVALIQTFAGDLVYLPIGSPSGPNPSAPTLRTVARLSESQTARQIAKTYGCTARTIHNKRASIRKLKEAGQWPPK